MPKNQKLKKKDQSAAKQGVVLPPRVPLSASNRGSLTFTTTAAFTTIAPALVIITNTVHNCFQTGVVGTPNKTQYFRQFVAFKVIGYNLRIEMQNTGADPVYAYFLHSNVDPTTTVTNYPAQSNNPYCSSRLLGAATSGAPSRFVHRARNTIGSINGNWRAVMADDTWSGAGAGIGASTADPIDKTYCGVGMISAVGAGAITVAALIHIEYDVIFWDRGLTVV